MTTTNTCACGRGQPCQATYAHAHNRRKPAEQRRPCACGCGELAGLSQAGKANTYIAGHQLRTEQAKRNASATKRSKSGRSMEPLVPQLCACGCGELAAVDERRNRVAKFVSGHNSRVAHPMKGKQHTAEAKAKLATYTGEKASSFKHGLSATPTWKSWKCMLERCYDPRNASYKHYGAKGVTVCQRWQDDFMNFVSDMGMRPFGMTLDRIDPGGDYERGNCRWATPAQQTANRRPNSDPGGWKAGRRKHS